ncbi:MULTISPECIES: hypothetical protein [Cysteiniphilum]|nr:MULTISPECIES: hypothetical protein [Cysteiniphilum]
MVNKQLIDCTGDPSIEKNGIVANTAVTINLASNCWAAGRVFIGQSSIVEMQPNAPLAPDSKYSYQLLEYTFSHGDTVDYDFSAVDAFSDIPVAMEAFMPTTSQPQIGWVGMSDVPNYKGIVIDVGSTKSLPNTSPYTPPPPPSKYNINIGGGWTTITGNVCGKAVGNESVIPLNFDKTCDVSLTMNKGQSADNTKFHLEKNSSGNLVLSNCSGNICQQINVDAKNIYLPGAPA